MRLILHAGTHKTGTTSIQKTLYDNREWLREKGIYYPDPRERFSGTFEAHHPFAHAIAGGPDDLARAEAFVADVRRRAATDDTIVLSMEPVYRFIVKHDGRDWWDAHRDYLNRMAVLLTEFEIEALLVFRRRDSFIESVYHERVAAGYARSFPQMIRQDADRLLDYERQVRCFDEAFGEVRTCSYEMLCASGLVNSFLDLLGVSEPPISPKWQRRSMDARLTQWMAREASMDKSRGMERRRRRFARSSLAESLFDDFGQVTLWTDPSERIQLLRRYGDTDEIRDARRAVALDDEMAARIDDAFGRFSSRWGDRGGAGTTVTSIPKIRTGSWADTTAEINRSDEPLISINKARITSTAAAMASRLVTTIHSRLSDIDAIAPVVDRLAARLRRSKWWNGQNL